ncbi:hypothetical protein ABIC99_001003 [Sphaerotilus sulfidivorans]|uniref:Uncharacterized protein n=1 Tax=Sphaerotilus sulfidivorans TaxID=639200 RepID=A0A5C1Q0Z7_9BURK|nr:hypothetical protein [Sphaerotilus sulfidivorans]NZD46526.1 hypothetical protein [Sphaerotilus sulfidivorans]QEN00680.1 hypothetical protein EWH46_07740 [Sphaerotilus sulfidivorans]
MASPRSARARARLAVSAVLAALMFAASGMQAASAQLVDTRILFANSKCKYPIRFLIHHKDSDNPHHPHAWYHFRPWEEKRLQANDVVLRQIVGQPLYLFAETIQEPGVPGLIWGGDDAIATLNDVGYRLRRVSLTVNSRGELEFEFNCPGT